ncbi:adenylate kinase [Oxobacter pfennigii]|uniref:Adenylate kinase n=1 Tax=Oxobacter pfennigii TaxID=36849 RepID=A0A0N8NTX8_9CLOT|nr:adenylate kinase [Oxobacter pfennigii]KPU46072.1 adenylate kinase [Oxobacter pfennigii]
MRIILLGAPGSGKGTQAARIQQKYNIPHISTGDIFRSNIQRQTEIGMEAKKYMDQGLLVPDELTLRIVESRLMEDDCQIGFMLDGFPRTTVQAEALDKRLNELGKSLNVVISLDVNDDTIIKRITGRQVCKSCGEVFNLYFKNPAEAGKCDKCGGELYTRADDTEETVAKRLKVYGEQTYPLIDFYSKKGNLVKINGEQEEEQVFYDITQTLNSII